MGYGWQTGDTIPQLVERALGIGHGFIEETIFVLGVEDKLVGSAGLSNSSTAWYLIPEFNKLPDVGCITTGINYETVAAVDSDLVIVRKSVYFQDQGDKAVETIESLDIPVIVLRDPDHFHISDITTIYQEIGLLGRIFNQTESAQKLIDEMDIGVTSIAERTKTIKEEDRPRVLFFGLGSSGSRNKGEVVVVWAKECASTFTDLFNIKSAYEGIGRNVLSAEYVLNLIQT